MDRAAATAALRDAERRTTTVREGSRWPATLLAVWGATTLIVEPAFAFVADRPWTMAFPFAVMAIFITWMSVYVGKQRVTASGFTRRYLTAVLAWSLLHVAYTLLVAAAGFRSLPFILAGAVVVAAPLFAGAYIEARRA